MNRSRHPMLSAVTTFLGLALVACSGTTNEPEDPKPADSIDVAPHNVIDDPTLRSPGEEKTPTQDVPPLDTSTPGTSEPRSPAPPPPPPPSSKPPAAPIPKP